MPKRAANAKVMIQGIASLVNHDIEIGFGQWHGDVFCAMEWLDSEIDIFDVISWWKAICAPILLRVSYFLISVTELWDMIIRPYTYKRRTHCAKAEEPKSACKTTYKLHFCFAITVKWQSKSYIWEEIYWQNLNEWGHMSCRMSGSCSIWICLNDDRYTPFNHASNCITLHKDLVHMVEILETAYSSSWKLRRRSWMRKGVEVERY